MFGEFRNTFDALTSHRPYRKALKSEEAILMIDEQNGKQFDPEIVEIFINLWWKTHFREIILHSAQGIPLVRCPNHGEIIERSAYAVPGDRAYCPACKLSFQLEENDGHWIVVMN